MTRPAKAITLIALCAASALTVAEATTLLDQEEATATFKQMKEMERDFESDEWEAFEKIQTDVMSSGYWFVLCLDIETVWEQCRSGGDESLEPIVPKFECDEISEAETEEERRERCHTEYQENLCRNRLLRYFARMKQAESVYNAMLWLDDFRLDLLGQCKATFQALTDYPFFDVQFDINSESTDELKNALFGLKQVQNVNRGDLKEFKVLQPNFWMQPPKKSEDVTFHDELLVPEDMVEIQGEYTDDLDLFFSEDDVKHLFSYVYKDYEKICDLALQSFKAQEDQEQLQAINDQLMAMEFNYLSEDQQARDALFHVCTQNTLMEVQDQKLFHNSKELFDRLFT